MEKAGFRIGFIGLTTAETATSTNPEKSECISFEEEIAIPSDSVDAIVLIPHMDDNPVAVKTHLTGAFGRFFDRGTGPDRRGDRRVQPHP